TSTGYIYDADGNLLLQKDPSSTTLYLGSEQITVDSAGTTTGVRYYAAPGGATIVRTGASTNYGFELDADQHGTNTLYLDSTAQTPTWRQFDPYGNPRGTTTSWPENRTFLNKTTDTTTGLTDIGAREYDPTTGRFTSLDPVFEATTPQELGGYTYAGSNPVTDSDPTGLCPVDLCGVGTPKGDGSGGGCYYMLKDPCGGVTTQPSGNGGSRCYYMLKDPCGTTYSNSGGTAHQSNSGHTTPVYKKRNRNADHGHWWGSGLWKNAKSWAGATVSGMGGFFTKHWRGMLQTAGFVACVVYSVGLCAVATIAVIGAEYAGDAYTHGWDSKYAWGNLETNSIDGAIGLGVGISGGLLYGKVAERIGMSKYLPLGRHSARYFEGPQHAKIPDSLFRGVGYGVNTVLGHLGCGDTYHVPSYC
ncbi:RHS repeat-associated core domain-containing protein, partial [Streptomyces sp. TRM68367]|uniref:RHS repeat-associated core domain-containing protein n=1 Tax=Streptomyces sp. TRM68367 TaxID=2758415 RepID=UPI0019A3CE9C